MSTSISTTGSVSSAGIGSGLDVTGIISKLMTVESAPLTALQTKATGIQTKISAFAAVKSAISGFRDAARTLTNPSTWSATLGTSGDPSTVTVVPSATAATGSYAITVQNLAASQSIASRSYADSTAVVGAGSLHIDLGSWNTGNTAFTAQTGNAGVDLTVSATATLADVRDQINAAGAGVTASIVTDTTGARLVMTSAKTGVNNGFRITSTDADGVNNDSAGLSALAYNPPGSTTSTLSQTAANASATINGLSVSSASNNLAGAVDGLTLNLVKVNTTPVLVTVAQDNTSITAAIQGFATAYNTLSTLLETDTKYDSTTSTAGPLQADSTAVSVQRQLRNILGASSTASTAFSTLSQAGLEIQSDGTISVNSTKLTSALGNLGEVKKLFANSGTGGNGFATQMRSLTTAMLASDGQLTSRTSGLATSLTSNQKQQADMNSRLATTKARLTAQYTALDKKMASLSGLSDYVTQQITNWNKNNG